VSVKNHIGLHRRATPAPFRMVERTERSQGTVLQMFCPYVFYIGNTVWAKMGQRSSRFLSEWADEAPATAAWPSHSVNPHEEESLFLQASGKRPTCTTNAPFREALTVWLRETRGSTSCQALMESAGVFHSPSAGTRESQAFRLILVAPYKCTTPREEAAAENPDRCPLNVTRPVEDGPGDVNHVSPGIGRSLFE